MRASRASALIVLALGLQLLLAGRAATHAAGAESARSPESPVGTPDDATRPDAARAPQKLDPDELRDVHHILHPHEHRRQFRELRAKIDAYVASTGAPFKGHIPDHLLEHFMRDDEL